MLNGHGRPGRMRSGAKAILARVSGPARGRSPRVLMYHSVDTSGSLISVPPERFRSQMEHLRASGWKTVTLREAVEMHPRRERAVALTFDDGFANLYTDVFPVLRRLGMTATVFLVTDFVGGRAEWHARDRHVIEELVATLPGVGNRAAHLDRLTRMAAAPMLSWPQIREMAAANFEFGGHTASHPYLPEVSPARTEDEIRRGMSALATEIGRPPRFFAYPYGASTPAARECLRAIGCARAFTAGPAGKRPDGRPDPLALPRTGISGWDDEGSFRFRLSRASDMLARWRGR